MPKAKAQVKCLWCRLRRTCTTLVQQRDDACTWLLIRLCRRGVAPVLQGNKELPRIPRTPWRPHTPCFSCTKVGDLDDDTLRGALRGNAIKLLEQTAERVRRRGNVPFPPSFVLAGESGGIPPLAKMIQGGRGGAVRLKLYLCITMMATGIPYDLRRSPAPTRWAELLALPQDGGPRRVSSNLRWLEKNSYISIHRQPPHTPTITLLAPDGTGKPYVLPRHGGRYLGVPVELWTEGWIIDLSATAVALLLCLLELQGGHTKPRYVTKERRARYRLSSDTWTRATKELEDCGLLTVGRTPQGGDFDYRRLRNTYWVDTDKIKHRPVPSDSGTLLNFESSP